jgi:hypothetical protein
VHRGISDDGAMTHHTSIGERTPSVVLYATTFP